MMVQYSDEEEAEGGEAEGMYDEEEEDNEEDVEH